jgi:hypothetical protein
MAGFGTGGYPHPRRKPVNTDAVPALNVHTLYRVGALIAGTTTRWQWLHPVTPLTILVRAETSRVGLAVDGADEVLVQIAYEPGTRGGGYPLFICPACHTQRWHLYARDFRFACRVCHCLDYRSRHEFWSPALRRAAKLRRRLGADPRIGVPLPRPPRHYRARLTYDCFAVKIATAEAEVRAKVAHMLDALAGRAKRGAKCPKSTTKTSSRNG